MGEHGEVQPVAPYVCRIGHACGKHMIRWRRKHSPLDKTRPSHDLVFTRLLVVFLDERQKEGAMRGATLCDGVSRRRPSKKYTRRRRGI